MKSLHGGKTLPSSFLFPDENVALTFVAEDQEMAPEKGADPMFVICLELKPREEDNIRAVSEYLEAWQNFPLQRICLLILSSTSSRDLQRTIKERLGIFNFIQPNIQEDNWIGTLLNVAQNIGDNTERRNFKEYRREKVLNLI